MDVFTTRAGRVRGRRSERDPGIVTVRGLPYAAPPFGAGRFREPRPARAWDGVRECTAYGPVAPQSAELPGSPVWSPGDEDVLTLNLWAPAHGSGGLPVLVWIHGGAYVFGSSAQPDFEGTALAARGLVVVTLNYRLGFEGFGHVPADDEGRACPDNRGLLDQIAALEWVRDNIAAFGGSPGRVSRQLVDAYRDRLPGPAPALDVYLALYGDLLFAEYSSRLAEAHARSGGRTFLSRFDRRRGGDGGRVRAWHCADIPFAFGSLHDENLHFLMGGTPGPADHELSHRMAGAWAGFAAHGDPGWAPLGGGGEGSAVRVWRAAGEEARETDAFRGLWDAAGLPLLAP